MNIAAKAFTLLPTVWAACNSPKQFVATCVTMLPLVRSTKLVLARVGDSEPIVKSNMVSMETRVQLYFQEHKLSEL